MRRSQGTFTMLLLAALGVAISSVDSESQAYRHYRKDSPSSKVVLQYMAHLQGIGDIEWVLQPGVCGTTGQNRRLEGFAIEHGTASQDEIVLRYKVFLQDLGVQGWTYMPDFAGTRGEKRRLEALWIEVVDKPDKYSVVYRAHLHGTGWTPWARDGAMCGTQQQQRAVEAIQVMVIDRD